MLEMNMLRMMLSILELDPDGGAQARAGPLWATVVPFKSAAGRSGKPHKTQKGWMNRWNTYE